MTKPFTALLKKSKSNLDAARELLKSSHYDAAVSRAYYAMFYVAEALLLDLGLSYSKHSGVIAAFGKHYIQTNNLPSEFHEYLIKGQQSRTVSDYDFDQETTREEAARQIGRAEKFIQHVEMNFKSKNA